MHQYGKLMHVFVNIVANVFVNIVAQNICLLMTHHQFDKPIIHAASVINPQLTLHITNMYVTFRISLTNI